jgi:acetylornithine deacetylase
VIDDSLVAGVLMNVTPARLVELARSLRRSSSAGAHESGTARSFATHLEAAGLRVEIDDVVPDRPNVTGWIDGRGDGPGLMLVGHFNAGFCPGGWRSDPYDVVESDGRLYGGAVSDMVGGLAAIIGAVEALGDEQPPGDVVVLGTMSHDIKAVGVKYALASRSDWPRRAIWADPTDLQLVLQHAGGVRWQVAIEGVAAHISRQEEGADALAAGARFVERAPDRIADRFADLSTARLPRVNVGEMSAGVSPGLVADSCVIRGDIRTAPGMRADAVMAVLQELAAETCEPQCRARVSMTGSQRPFTAASRGALPRQLIEAHTAITGTAPLVDASSSAEVFCTAAADLDAYGIDTVVYGPGEFKWQPNESIALTDLVVASRVYLRLLMSNAVSEA